MKITEIPVHLLFSGFDDALKKRILGVLDKNDLNINVEDHSSIGSVENRLSAINEAALVFLADNPLEWADGVVERLKFNKESTEIAVVICLFQSNMDALEMAFAQGANVVFTVPPSDEELSTGLAEILFHFRQHQAFKFRKDTFFLMR